MKTFAATPRVRTAAFTMVEIALCLAIVGFALVAIIGVLPAGLNVQKENREETIINQDATLILNALRGSDRGNDELTNLFERITVTRILYAAPNFLPKTNDSITAEPKLRPARDGEHFILLDSAEVAVGLLCTPKYQPYFVGNTVSGFISNHVVAYVRAASGAATEKVARDNPVRDMAFGYRLVSEVMPREYADFSQLYTNDVGNAFARNMHELRLVFAWPLTPPLDPQLSMPTNFGTARLIYRTQVGGAGVRFGIVPIPSRTDDDMFFFYLNPDGNGRHL